MLYARIKRALLGKNTVIFLTPNGDAIKAHLIKQEIDTIFKNSDGSQVVVGVTSENPNEISISNSELEPDKILSMVKDALTPIFSIQSIEIGNEFDAREPNKIPESGKNNSDRTINFKEIARVEDDGDSNFVQFTFKFNDGTLYPRTFTKADWVKKLCPKDKSWIQFVYEWLISHATDQRAKDRLIPKEYYKIFDNDEYDPFPQIEKSHKDNIKTSRLRERLANMEKKSL
jgi:hypothetical protein